MKNKEEMDNTDTNSVYKKNRKRVLDNEGLIKCSICKYHDGENSSKKQRNWKKNRKKKYKVTS